MAVPTWPSRSATRFGENDLELNTTEQKTPTRFRANMLNDFASDYEWDPSPPDSFTSILRRIDALSAALRKLEKRSLPRRLLGDDLDSPSKLDWLFSLDYSVQDADKLDLIERDHFADDQLKIARDFYLAILANVRSSTDETR